MSSELPEFDSNPVDDRTNDPTEIHDTVSALVIPPNQPVPSSHPEFDPEPRWLHPLSLLFGILSHARQLVIPLFLAIFSAAKGSFIGLSIAAGVFVIALAVTIFRYLTLRYQVKGDDLIVKEGLIFRRVRTVPIRRIQNMDLVQNVMHRIFQVAEVKIETASGTEPEATLRVLTMPQIQELRERVFGSISDRLKPNPDEVSDETNADPYSTSVSEVDRSQPVTILKIPTSWLVKAGLASNRGGLIFGVIFGFLFQFDLEDQINWKAITSYVPSFDGSLQTVLIFLAAFVGILTILRIFGIIWYILRFHGYELQRIGDDLRIRCGLLTKVSATVPRKRIQFISIHRSFILRWMGMSVIRIETAGGSGTGNEDAATTVSRRWFVPVVQHELVENILLELRPGLEWDPNQAAWMGLSKRAPARMSRLAVIFCVLAAIAGFFAIRPWGVFIGLGLIPFAVWFALQRSKSMKYARTAFGVVYRSGIFTKKLSLTFFERIQTLRVNQSPFDRRWKMAKLVVDTAAAGPAEHTINVGYLDEAFAFQELDALTSTSSQHRPSWTG